MANTYTQLHIQFVFAVKFRKALIQQEWKGRLHEYITGIFQANKHKMLQINSMPDHIHIFIGMRPNQSVSALIQNVKTESSKWIKKQKICSHPFEWSPNSTIRSYGTMIANLFLFFYPSIVPLEQDANVVVFLNKKLLMTYAIWNSL